MVVSWIAINYLVVESVATKVYGDLSIKQKPLGNLKEMAESHGMPEMANVEILPEGEGKKLIVLEIEGIFCGACGPALEYDVKSILGVSEVERSGSTLSVTYDSDITSKNVIVASIHEPYSAKIISEVKLSYS
jgi:copper chaperone CopZ